MTLQHPAAAPILAAVLVGGRVLLDVVAPSVGEAWQRGVEALAALAAVAVFLKFSRGDPPRWPWALVMATTVGVIVARATGYAGLTVGEDVKVVHVLFIACNLLVALSMIAFNRLLGSSELLSERAAESRWRAHTVVVLLALGAVAALAVNTFEVSRHGWPTTAGAWVATASAFVSTLSDALVCAGGVYLVWLVRPMLGGSLARPYLLLAISAGASLVVDFLLAPAGVVTQTELGLASALARVAKAFGCLAYALLGLAAAEQFWLLRSAGRRDGA